MRGAEILTSGIIAVVLFAAIFGLVYVYLVSRHRERMTIIEKNISEPPFRTLETTNLLKYGIISLGIATGVIVGNILQHFGLEENFSYTAMVFLFGGISLIISFLVVRKYNK